MRAAIEMGRMSAEAREPAHIAVGMHNLAELLVEQGQLEAAEKEAREALELRLKSLGDGNPETVKSRELLAEILKRRGN
jgi:hypothetical protein